MLSKLNVEYQGRQSLKKGGNELAECNLALLRRGAANMLYSCWFQKTDCTVKDPTHCVIIIITSIDCSRTAQLYQ